jgi:hypothetical protein
MQDTGISAALKKTDEWDVPDTYQRYQGEIFCNRALNMKRIRAVGFDMDYTLAQYIPETFEILGAYFAWVVGHIVARNESVSLRSAPRSDGEVGQFHGLPSTNPVTPRL